MKGNPATRIKWADVEWNNVAGDGGCPHHYAELIDRARREAERLREPEAERLREPEDPCDEDFMLEISR